MARETREDRLVRSMLSQLTEQMIELKSLASAPSKESDVEAWCQSMFKSVLGYSASSGYLVRNQETRGKMRFDLVIAKADKPDELLLVVEIKKLGSDLNKSDFRSGKTQLMEYMKSMGGVRWGILTNGFEWRLYDFKNDMVKIVDADIRNDQKDVDTSSRAIQEVAWTMLDFSSHFFEKDVWDEMSTEATALSPDSLARAILSVDIVKRVGRYLNGEHDYKASIDLLTDKISELLELGLNESMTGWNESKKAEMEGYIRKQKRQAKKTRKRQGAVQDASTGSESEDSEASKAGNSDSQIEANSKQERKAA